MSIERPSAHDEPDFCRGSCKALARISELTESHDNLTMLLESLTDAVEWSVKEGLYLHGSLADMVSQVRLARGLNEDFTPLEADDRAFASLVMDGEAEYLARFLTDLQAGRYTDADGELKGRAVAARARMYTGKYRGTANEVFVLSSPEGDEFAWHQLTVEPCEDCPRIEAGGPYTAEALALIGHPGQGRQQCRTNCGCVVVRLSDGRFGFSRSYD
jgi:hypothetical protein